MKTRIIFHVDLDAFFASVEQRDQPSLKGKPVIVGADPKEGKGRGVVSTCSYEARAFGVRSAMPITEAYRRCPGGVYLLPDMERYQRASEDVFEVFEQFTPDIEPVSIDEAFLDMGGCCHLFGTPAEAARKLKDSVLARTGLTASVGIAPNKMLAKIASDLKKPDGLVEVDPAGVNEFLLPLSVERLWGVGPKTAEVLKAFNILTVGDLAGQSQPFLQQHFGALGEHLYHLSHGIDDRPVEVSDEIKSVSNEETFDEDTQDRQYALDTILRLSEKVSRRLRNHQLKGRTITLKVRLKGFYTHSHALTISERTNHADVIFRTAKELFLRHYRKNEAIRLVGVRVSNFEDAYVQESLFSNVKDQRREAIHQALDDIQDRFGNDSIRRAGACPDRDEEKRS
ncbi:MAG TPA: DNA polymerase IV [Candidatus Omnitrophota bacterium]|nr:DNA polymerase IV [Candidatus Omnitrophota bacterium]